ncbi:MAG: YfhO family protein [Chloroflexota bacterium]
MPWYRAHTQSRARDAAAHVIIALALTGLFGRAVVAGTYGHERDTTAFYFPLTFWVATELSAGRFPLWCPLVFGGYPIVADGEIGLFYPLTLLSLLASPPDSAFLAVRSMHYFIAAGGAFWFARGLDVGRLGAVLAATSFSLGAFMVGHLDHPNILRSAAWLPFILGAADRAITRRRALPWLAVGGAALALSGLGLHPQILLVVLVGLGTYTMARAVAFTLGGGGAGAFWSHGILLPVLTLAAICCMGLLGAAVQLIPTYELGYHSSRAGALPYDAASRGSLTPPDLITLLLPHFFRAEPRAAWAAHPYWETSTFVGVVALLLVPLGCWAGPRRATVPLLAVGLLSVSLSLAQHAPVDLYQPLSQLPGFSSMRVPARYGLLTELVLATLAGVGLDAFRGVRPRRTAQALPVVVGVALSVLAGLATAAVLVRQFPGETRQLMETWLSSFPRHDPGITVETAQRGLLLALSLDHPGMLLSLLSAGTVVAAGVFWLRRRTLNLPIRGALLTLSLAELLFVAHAFHPTASIETLTSSTGPMRFLTARGGDWRAFTIGRADAMVTNRPLQFGISQTYGYSSLPTRRMERYWTRVNEVDDELLDLWQGRYVIESKSRTARVSARDVLFEPNSPLLLGAAGSPLGAESFRVGRTDADALRVLSYVEDVAGVPAGERVLEFAVAGGSQPPEVVHATLGRDTAEGRVDVPGLGSTTGARAAYVWEARDAFGGVHPRTVYAADIPLVRERVVERVDARVTIGSGMVRLVGLALGNGAAGRTSSILRHHRAKYQLVFEDAQVAIYENREVLPRAFVTSDAVIVEPDDWSLVRMLDRGFDLRRQLLLEPPAEEWIWEAFGSDPEEWDALVHARRDQFAEPANHRQPAAGHAHIEHYSNEVVELRTVASEPGFVILTDTYYPGWRAYVDGVETPVWRANYLFRGVAIPKGEHTVELRFEPASIRVGLVLSAIGWVGIGAIAWPRGLARGSSLARDLLRRPTGEPGPLPAWLRW